MELRLEVLASASIKRKKPWPKMAWLGKGDSIMGLYLLDTTRISQLSPSTGKTKKSFPSLASIDSRIVLTTHSSNGSFLAGLTTVGDIFTWYEHTQELRTYRSPLSGQGVDDRAQEVNITVLKACKLFVADSGELGVLIVRQSEVYLWRMGEGKALQWWKVSMVAGSLQPLLPELDVQVCFYSNMELGYCCSVAFVHSNRDTSKTVLNHLLIQWHSPKQISIAHTFPSSLRGYATAAVSKLTSRDGHFHLVNPVLNQTQNLVTETSPSGAFGIQGLSGGVASRQVSVPSDAIHNPTEWSGGTDSDIPFQVSSKATPLSLCQSPPHRRGGYCMVLCPTGSMLAVAVNCPNADDCLVFFFSWLTGVGLPVPLYAGMKQAKERVGRTYWIAGMGWTADGLFVACINKRGSVLIMPRFGHPVLLVTYGCSLDMGPALSLPLHPLITVISADKMVTNHETSESSERDPMRQRFSLSTHPYSPMLVCSDGYCFTILKLTSSSLPNIIISLTNSARRVLGLVPLEAAMDQSNVSAGSEDREEGSSLCPDELQASGNIATREPALEGTLGSSLKVGGKKEGGADGTWGPLDPAVLDAEGGVIHFADVDSDVDPTLGWTGGASLVRCAGFSTSSVKRAMPCLYAALVQLLSCSPLEVGNGAYPSSKVYSKSQISYLKAAVVRSSVLTISTLASVVGFLCAAANGKDWEGVVSTCLDLLGLDSIAHRHFSCSSLFVNAISQVLLSHTLTLHKQLKAQLCSKFNLQDMLDVVVSVQKGVDNADHCLQQVWAALESTYSPAPSLVSEDLGFASSVPLSSTLASAARLLTLLLGDLRLCRVRIRHWKGSTRKESMVRKWGGLYRQARSSVKSCAISAQCLLDAVMGSLGTAVMTSPETPALPQEQVCCQGNPITCMDNTVASALGVLYRRLESYDLKCALEISSSYLTPREAPRDVGSAPSMGSIAREFGQSSKVSLTGTVGLERILSDVERMSKRVGPLTEAGSAVLASLSRFMVAFFCKRRLLIFPSSHPCILPPLSPCHCPESGASWFLELDRSRVTRALSEQGVGSFWSPDYTVQLMLLCGLWEEACEFLVAVGEWKKGLLVAAACYGLWDRLEHAAAGTDQLLRKDSIKKLACSAVEKVLLPHLLVKAIPPCVIAGAEGFGAGNQVNRDLVCLVSGSFNVCALVGFDDVVVSILTKLAGQLVATCTRMPLEVPLSCPLPSPPLFMLQPGIEEEVYLQCPLEFDLRNTLVALTQNMLLVLRASNCLLSCVHWYACMLRELHTSSNQPLCVPERDAILSNESPSSGTFLRNFNIDCCCFSQDICNQSSEVKVILSAFRELCAIHWTLHVRDQAFLHIRRLRSLRSSTKKDPTAADQAVRWTARLLPFVNLLSHTDNSDIDHILLALLAELPCDHYLADLMAFYYPTPPTAEALTGRFDRLVAKMRSHCTVPTSRTTGGEPISVRYHVQGQTVLTKQQELKISLTFESSLCHAASDKVEADQGGTSGVKTSQVCVSRGSSLPTPVPGSTEEQCTAHHPDAAMEGFIFEHDKEYIKFVDTFFELVLSTGAHAALGYTPCGLGISPRGQGVEPDQPPFLGIYWNTVGIDANGPCWMQVIPLVSLFHEWTETQLCDLGSLGVGPPSVSQGGPRKKSGIRRNRKQVKRPSLPSPLFVTLPVGQIVHSLQLEEDRRRGTLDRLPKHPPLQKVESHDQSCQEEDRETYLQRLQSLEVESIAGTPPNGGENDQDGSLEEEENNGCFVPVADGAPSSVHTSTAPGRDQGQMGPQHSSVPLAIRGEPLEPSGIRGSGTREKIASEEEGVAEKSVPYLGTTHTAQQAYSIPLLQVPATILQGTIPFHPIYQSALQNSSMNQVGATPVELSTMEDDSKLISVGEVPLSATLSIGEIESDTLSMIDLDLNQTGVKKEMDKQKLYFDQRANELPTAVSPGVEGGDKPPNIPLAAATATQVCTTELGTNACQKPHQPHSTESNSDHFQNAAHTSVLACDDLNPKGTAGSPQEGNVGHAPMHPECTNPKHIDDIHDPKPIDDIHDPKPIDYAASNKGERILYGTAEGSGADHALRGTEANKLQHVPEGSFIAQHLSNEVGVLDPHGVSIAGTAADVLSDDDGKGTRPGALNGMTEIKKLLQLQHDYLMKVLDVSIPSTHPITHGHNRPKMSATGHAPGIHNQPPPSQPCGSVLPMLRVNTGNPSHEGAPLAMSQDVPVSNPSECSHSSSTSATKSAPCTREVQNTNSKSLSLLDLACSSSHTPQSSQECKARLTITSGSVLHKPADEVPNQGAHVGLPFLLHLPPPSQPPLPPVPPCTMFDEPQQNFHHTHRLLTIDYNNMEPTLPPPPPPPPLPPFHPPSSLRLPFPLLRVDYTDLPRLPHPHMGEASPPNSLPILTVPTIPSGGYPLSSEAREVRLPSVPVRPFVPRLIVPAVRSDGPLPLLQLCDPVTQLQRKGFPLLRIPPVADIAIESSIQGPQRSSLVGTKARGSDAVSESVEDIEGRVRAGMRYPSEKDRERRHKASRRRCKNRRHISWQKQSGQSFDADFDSSLLSSSSQSSLVSGQQATLQVPLTRPPGPEAAQIMQSQLKIPEASPPQMQMPSIAPPQPATPSQHQAPPTTPSQPDTSSSGPHQPLAPPANSQVPLTLTLNRNPLLENPLPSGMSLETRRRYQGATYLESSPEQCVDETKMAGVRSIASAEITKGNVAVGSDVVDLESAPTGMKISDHEGVSRAKHWTDQISVPPTSQTTEVVTTPHTDMKLTSAMHRSEHTGAHDTDQALISIGRCTLILTEHRHHPEEHGATVSQGTVEAGPLCTTSTVQSTKRAEPSVKSMDECTQCTLDNPPPLQFIHVGNRESVDNKCMPQWTEPQLSTLKSTSCSVTLTPLSAMLTPDNGAPEPISTSYAETKHVKSVAINTEAYIPDVEKMELGDEAGEGEELASFDEASDASRNKPEASSVEPETPMGAPVTPMGAPVTSINIAPIPSCVMPERVLRSPIEETWYAGNGAPIGRVKDNSFLKKLKILDDQLCAIEATAETIAGDFKASNRLLTTIDNLQSIRDISVIPSGGHIKGIAPALGSTEPSRAQTCVEFAPLRTSEVAESHDLTRTNYSPSAEIDQQMGHAFIHSSDQQLERITVTNATRGNGTQSSNDPKEPSTKIGVITPGMINTLTKTEAVASGAKMSDRDRSVQEKLKVSAESMKKESGVDSKTSRSANKDGLNIRKETVGAREKTRVKGIPVSSQSERNDESTVTIEGVPVKGKGNALPRQAEGHVGLSTPATTSNPSKKLSHAKPQRSAPQQSAQWKEFHARRVEDALILMADIMSSKPLQSSLQKSSASPRPPLRSREKNVTVVQRTPASQLQMTSGRSHGEKAQNTTTLMTTKKRTSTIEGLSQREQQKIAQIMASVEYEGSSVSSESIATSIDWEQVDKILAI